MCHFIKYYFDVDCYFHVLSPTLMIWDIYNVDVWATKIENTLQHADYLLKYGLYWITWTSRWWCIFFLANCLINNDITYSKLWTPSCTSLIIFASMSPIFSFRYLSMNGGVNPCFRKYIALTTSLSGTALSSTSKTNWVSFSIETHRKTETKQHRTAKPEMTEEKFWFAVFLHSFRYHFFSCRWYIIASQ